MICMHTIYKRLDTIYMEYICILYIDRIIFSPFHLFLTHKNEKRDGVNIFAWFFLNILWLKMNLISYHTECASKGDCKTYKNFDLWCKNFYFEKKRIYKCATIKQKPRKMRKNLKKHRFPSIKNWHLRYNEIIL